MKYKSDTAAAKYGQILIRKLSQFITVHLDAACAVLFISITMLLSVCKFGREIVFVFAAEVKFIISSEERCAIGNVKTNIYGVKIKQRMDFAAKYGKIRKEPL